MNETVNAALEHMAGMLRTNNALAPVLAFLAGVLTSVTPCSLSSIPLVVAYVGGTGRKDPKIAFRYSLVFAAGTAITFTALGAAASLLGKLLNFGTGGVWYLLLGILMILMALQTWGIITIFPATYAQSGNTRRGYPGAFAMGVLGGLFSSPCATPVLIALLVVVARNGTPVWGIFLLFLYSIGHSILVVLAGTFTGLAGKIAGSQNYGFFATAVNIALGFVILLAGLLLVYTGL